MTEEPTDGTVEELNGPFSEDAGLQIFEWCKAVKGRADYSSTAYPSPTSLHREITHSDPHLNIGGLAQDFSSVPLASMMQIQMQLGVSKLSPMALAVTDDVDREAFEEYSMQAAETDQNEQHSNPNDSTILAKLASSDGQSLIAIQLGGELSMRHTTSGKCMWHERLGQGANLIGVSSIDSNGLNNTPSATLVETKSASSGVKSSGPQTNSFVAACGWDGTTYIFDSQKNLVQFNFDDPVTAFLACRLSEGSPRNSDDSAELNPSTSPLATCLIYATFDNRIVIYTIDDILSNSDICAESTIGILGERAQTNIVNMAKEKLMEDGSQGLWSSSSDSEILAAFVKAAVQTDGRHL